MDFERDKRKVIAVTTVFVVVSTALIGVRVWYRVVKRRSWGLDDALILLSWVFAMAFDASVLTALPVGLGRPKTSLTPSQFLLYRKLIIIQVVTYTWACGPAKLSFAILYIRLFPSRILRWIDFIVLTVVACQIIEQTIVEICQCRPVRKAWDVDVDGWCINKQVLWYAGFGLDLAVYLVLFGEPIVPMWRLNMPTVKRVGVIVMLSFGLVNIVITILRIDSAMRARVDHSEDDVLGMLWSVVEISMLLICSCIPALRSVLQAVPWLGHALGSGGSDESPGNELRESPRSAGPGAGLRGQLPHRRRWPRESLFLSTDGPWRDVLQTGSRKEVDETSKVEMKHIDKAEDG